MTNLHSTTARQERILPIVEIIVDKNKATGLKKTIFFRLEPLSGRMKECTVAEQLLMHRLRNETRRR